uniref:Adenomatous polyposis coli protein isoform X1 n=3 Tax=Geotrypetes seraphini TaxID=260995 RepID=A0A6P8QCJ8_GEOSA|nr:adenomatous polyposis coli protein isoform X1 [Geotrypetes seraphini]XP_033784995.1 adenomatous polyposis coli protein isoform X1 [Geotrypetes seraphini]XP_033784996.1 adenomatous polyposis coli protein isoform X1 [Geotrypetes seraphini]XP_033784997.1 adenomatous polyposis coli protein isoform X1 [Geotrypetes seraphini]XP_033784998.1 adenomatous polyposis coli protein isoform X1 [Geotrypetes seraphini]XP_033785000.1 adenomatous polyposis coli protein isoform X1 [Geotrypetes seraphini]XP_03
MAAASYDQLLMQVEALKMENTNLRQELEDNSNHLTKLETEASNMKEVLKQLQGSIEDEAMASSGQIDLLERLKELNLESSNFVGVKLRPKMSLRSCGSREGSVSGRSGESSPVPVGSFSRRGFTNGSRESAGYLEELEKERSLLIAELEKEEKDKDWYYSQLQNLTKRIDGLPLTENFSLQTDMTRRQLEYEARQIRAAMEEQLGTCQDMEKRAQERVARIQQIEKDIIRVRQQLQSQAAEVERAPQSKHDAGSREAERQNEGQGAAEISTGSTGNTQGSSARTEHETSGGMNSSSTYSVPRRLTSHLGTKVEMVYSLLSMLGTHDKDDMSRTLLAMSSSQDSCIAMRQSGCLPLLIQLLHGNDKDSVLLGNSRGSKEARARASAALHNIIHSQPDDKRGRREIRVLHLLEQIRAYCETCWEWQEAHKQGMDQDKNSMPAPVEHQICPAVCVLMKLSFDEEHRHAMNELGGLQAIAELLQVDCEMYGLTNDHYSVTLRRYAGMALTNLTFGDVANKATLCSMKGCMRALVAQLQSESEDLQQVIASVLRNLSWRADVNSKKTLREVGSVKALMECALEVKKESTLKSVLSALWNLSAHCTENKADICAVNGALAFLVGTLTYRSQTNTLAIIESGGGILRNVSSLIATNEDHRQILRENNCLQTLLQHLKSHSLTIVSNACGTLWNLSARNTKDQEALWDMGAVSMLKNLIHSKHKMIAMGSAAALRNLMANRPAKYKDANIMSPGSSLPSLHVRKQKALEAELDAQHLSETFDNIDNLSPKTSHRNKQRHKQNLYSEYVLDSNRHEDSIGRPESFSTANVTVLSPYLNTTVLSGSSSSSRGNLESSRSERDRSLDRERTVTMTGYHSVPDNTGSTSKRIGIQMSSTAAQIAKVMEEVSSMHTPQEDRSSGSTTEMHCLTEERTALRRTSTSHSHSNTYNFTKAENSGRTCPMPYAKVEYKRASNDSLNSVSSIDGYGKRGQMKPSIESYSEDDESKFCSYGQYPADLAHKIHNANHMDDNDAELDTPINYSLKYSDEQLNSGRQSPSQNERWARPKHIIEDEMKQNEQRQSRSQNTAYSLYTEGNDEKHMKFQTHFGQSECTSPYRSRGHNNAEQSRGSTSHGVNQEVNQTLCQVDDYDDDKPTNYSERYSEEEQHEDEDDRQTNYSIEDQHHVDQPIDYSLKYSTDVPPSSQKLSFAFSKLSTTQNSTTDHISSNSGTTSTPSSRSNRPKHLHPNSSQSRGGQTQKPPSCKAPSINQETMQTYCVEDTPICFSRCSSLSSLSSAEDEIGRDQTTCITDTGSNLQIAEMKENSETITTENSVSEARSASQHIRTKVNRLQASNLSPNDSSRHKTVEFSSGAKSPSKSGAQTPKSPPEHYVQETPLMFSRCTSVSSLDSFESHSIASSVQSEPCSGMVSGIISPSDLPDSPGQTMPPSRSKTPPPPQALQVKKEAAKNKVPTTTEKRESGPKRSTINAAVQRVQVLPDADTLLHFATESTPDGFSCASSLSALSLDEPYIQKDIELRIMPPVHEHDHGSEGELEKAKDTNYFQEKRIEKQSNPEKDILDESDDDDIDILEECIFSAMPTQSSRKSKKPSQASASKIPPPVARKPSQLPVYKLLPSQNRLHPQKHVSFTHTDDMPRVYCVEGTPINFSTATSLSDLTIESPPNESTNVEIVKMGHSSSQFERRDTIPTEGRSTDDTDVGNSSAVTLPEVDNKKEEGDILAECIHSAMPKGKSHKPYRVKKIMDQIQHGSVTLSGNSKSQEGERKKPTSPVKPMPQTTNHRASTRKNIEVKNSFGSERSYGDLNKDFKKQNLKNRDFPEKLPNNEERVRGNFAFDSPHHYTPIEGTPYCFSRNDSLSSLDFDDDDVDLSREKVELRKGKQIKETGSETNENAEQSSSIQQSTGRTQLRGRGQSKTLTQKQKFFPQSKEAPDRGTASNEKVQNFAIENTPVCFSRNSSLSSLSDIDQENNNKERESEKQTEHLDSQVTAGRPQTSGYAPKSFHVEDTPVCFSRNSSLSSLSIDSEDDLLQECISSAMPKIKKPRTKGESEKKSLKTVDGILAEQPDLILDLRDLQSPDSENAFSPDSENFDWKAIQEGANSIVSSLHQAAAAAAASLSRQGSSDSDSILSLKSGISLGSPFHLTPDQEEKYFTSNKGPRILKPGEKSALENKAESESIKSIKGGKKVYKSMITGKFRSNSDVSNQLKQPQQTNMPSISRGRTMIHIPGVRNSSPSTSPVSKKTLPPKNTVSRNSGETQNSTSSRGTKTVKSEPNSVTRQPSTPGGSSKGPSRSGSRDSTPSRPAQQPLSRPMQSPGQNSISPGRNGISPPTKLSQLPRTSSPSVASTKSSGSGRISYASPGRQLSQQNMVKQTGLPKTTSGIPRSESASKGLNQNLSSSSSNKKVELSRMPSTKSSGSESDRSERPTLVRQSTFIKEAPSPTLRRKLEESASFESLSSSSRADSPTRSQIQTPVLSPSLPDMSLSTHSSIQVGGWRKLPPNLNPCIDYSDERPLKRHDITRSHSESPSRLPINRSGTWKREHSKHSSSLPRVSTWRRTGSSSSILSASSESSEKAKSEDEKHHASSFQGHKQIKENQAPAKGTWRKIKENEIPQIMNNLPQNCSSGATNGATNGADSKTLLYQMAPAVSKTEDVWVRIEDCPINNPRSGKSPTGNTPPVIDNVSEQDIRDDKDIQGKQNAGNGNLPVRPIGLENRLNLLIQTDIPDKKGTEPKPVVNNPLAPETNENSVAERTPFSSSSSSKHSSPSGAVAARVTPFNYNPSPRKSSIESNSIRPSQIPTPVNNSTKKRESKTDTTDSNGTQSPKRHSGSYLVTSV